MTQALFLARKTAPQVGQTEVNGLHSVLINLVDSSNAAAVKAAALVAARAAGHDIADDGYFNEVWLITTASGLLNANTHAIFFEASGRADLDAINGGATQVA